MRILIGGIFHQTNTFSTKPTALDQFRQYQGTELMTAFEESNTAVGGFLAGANIYGFEPIPTLYAEASMGGPTPRPDFDQMVQQLIQAITEADPIDGILLSLHGGMAVGNLDSSEGLHDAEGFLLQQIRQAVGDDVPIVCQLALHANVSAQMIEIADVLIGGETFPVIDAAARGRECVEILMAILDENAHPTMALYPMPLIWGINQITNTPPMKEAIAYLHELENRAGVIKVSLALGNPFADVSEMGASAYVITENNQTLAQQYAKELGIYCQVRRKEWHDNDLSSIESLRYLEEKGQLINLSAATYKRLSRKLFPIDDV